jgi:hypothetical protein
MNPVNNFFLNFNIQLKMSFKNACKNNDIELAKTCKMPDKNTFDK